VRSEYIRSTRPAGPPIPKIRLLGTSWYRRRVGYWARRAGLTCVYLLLLGLVGFIVGDLIYGAVTEAHGIARVVALVVLVGITIASYVHAIQGSVRRRHERRDGITPLTPEQRREQQRRQRRSGRFGLGTGVGASGGSAVGGAFLFVGSLVFIGAVTMIVVDSLGRYLNNDEYFAVQKVEAWRAEHPGVQP
jgi:hypothetical protein